MAVITEKYHGINNNYSKVFKNILMKLLRVLRKFKESLFKIFKLIFIHKNEPVDDLAKKTYLSYESKTRIFTPKNLDTFTRL